MFSILNLRDTFSKIVSPRDLKYLLSLKYNPRFDPSMSGKDRIFHV